MPGMNHEANLCAAWLRDAGRRARAASAVLASSTDAERAAGLRAAAASLRRHVPAILAANEADVVAFHGTAAFRDRLTLTPPRVEAMARGLEEIAALPDPLARVLAEWTRPNGLRFQRVAAPIGVIGMVYESRPNVGADAAGLCVKSGNAVVLRGGSDSRRSAAAIHAALTEGLDAAGLPRDAVQVAPGADRGFVAAMLAGSGLLDLIIPRGGRSLVERVQRDARVPVLAHAEGLNHTFVHEAADPAMARAVLANAKMRRTGVCGATETLLIDAACAPALLPPLVADLEALGCAFRADPRARAILPHLPRRRMRISTRNGWTPCCRSPWWTAWTRRWPTSPATAASTRRRSSRRTPPSPTASCAAWARPWRCGTLPPSSATAASSASARRSASPPGAPMPAAPWAWSS